MNNRGENGHEWRLTRLEQFVEVLQDSKGDTDGRMGLLVRIMDGWIRRHP